MLYKFLINPYFLYSTAWIAVMVLYTFHWTYLYPELSDGLRLFLLMTSFGSACWGFYKYKKKAFDVSVFMPTQKHYSFAKRITKIAFAFFVLEFVAFRTVPLISYILGHADSELYQEFGLPFVHVIAVNLFLVVEFVLFQSFMSAKDKRLKYKFLKLFVINLGILSLLMNRAVLMYVIFGSIIIFCVSKKNVAKYIGGLVGLMFVVFFLFGMLGNIRNGGDNETGKQYILNLCEATPEFKKSIVPAEFIWPYVYVTSPLSNVEFTIRRTHPDVTFDNCMSFFINECMPMLISKRLGAEQKSGKLVLENLNVGSVYMNSYAYIGWYGMIFQFFFMFVFVEVSTSFVPKKDVLFLPLMVLLDIVIVFNIFDNMFIFSGLVPAVFVTIVLSFFNHRYKFL